MDGWLNFKALVNKSHKNRVIYKNNNGYVLKRKSTRSIKSLFQIGMELEIA